MAKIELTHGLFAEIDDADAFIKRKGHDYREGLRVYVDATSYSWELNTIKAAILDGRIGFIPKDQS